MSISNKVKAVEKIFASLEIEIAQLSEKSGLQCIAGCGKCCFKADIEATPLEFLPFAFHLFLTKRIQETYDELLIRKSPLCSIFKSQKDSLVKGSCSSYKYRGLICRLFGFSAVRNKYGSAHLITCAPLKLKSPKQVQKVTDLIEQGNGIPMMNDYYFQMRSIDPELGSKQLPINQAIKEALEVVMSYYAYRKPPPGYNKLSA